MPSDTPDHDISPAETPSVDKKRGESFDRAANRPNDPSKPIDFNKGDYNVSYNYCNDDED